MISSVFLNSIPVLAADTKVKNATAYTDIADDDEALYINYLTGKEIIKGYSNGTFKPNEGLSRAEAAVVLVKSGKLEIDSQAASPFKDVKAGHWARSYIAAAVKAGYIVGYPDGTFRPDAKITRATGQPNILLQP